MPRLLVVDTQTTIPETFNTFLERCGHYTLCAPNSAEALEKARRSHPDAVISDALMPAGEAFAFCRKWKRDENLREIPFVFLAPQNADRTAEARAFELGADRFLRASAEPETAVAAIETVLGEMMAGPGKGRCLNSGHFLSFLENMEDAAYEADTEGTLIYANGAAARLLGISREEMVGRSFLPLVAENDHKKAVEIFLQTLAGKPVEYELTMANGMIGHFKNTPQKDEAGNIVGVYGIARDISERKMAEKKLLEAKAFAEAANRAKSEFLSNISHELRTPLNAVIGFSQVLSDQHFGRLNGKQAEYVCNIHQSGTHLLGLIDEILDLARLESEKTAPDLQPVRIESLLGDGLDLIRARAAAAGIAVETVLPPGLAGVEVMADPALLRQVLLNLLTNAVKFTPHGGAIRLESKIAADFSTTENPNGPARPATYLEISVCDTGVGLGPGERENIFDPFFQGNAGHAGKTPGTGLGLALARRIMTMHGGRIRAESDGKGRGSRFVLSLPAPAD